MKYENYIYKSLHECQEVPRGVAYMIPHSINVKNVKMPRRRNAQGVTTASSLITMYISPTVEKAHIV